ncbi:MAG: DUF5318 family protein [Actinomycetota bacterium]|nr:DUF5318 family protein [Actinomycetota bacterium]
MHFGPPGIRGFPTSGDGGRVEYRLARNAVVRSFQRGRLGRPDVCDAHPELLRAARHIGVPVDEACPICESAALVHVTYVFGPRLPAQGRCPATPTELDRLLRRADPVVCYVVEVCPDCAWNHLVRMYPAGRRRGRVATVRAGAAGQGAAPSDRGVGRVER